MSIRKAGRWLPRLGGLIASAIFIAACSAAGASPAPSAAPTPAPTAAPAGQNYEVTVVTDAKLGRYLAGEDGKTLYVFKQDTTNTSNCAGGCATTWPPLTLDVGEQVKAGTGVGGTLTTFARLDGKMQVSYNGAPLYYYSGDQTAGDTKGDGIGDVWHVATPQAGSRY